MSAPASPGPVIKHDGTGAPSLSSPVVEENPHTWHAPVPGQVRSPCPALNTLANHGFLPRDGKQLTAPIITHALEEGYGLSSTLAHILVIGGIALLGQVGAFSLSDLARHNRIEHDASIVHDDTPARDEYAPIAPDSVLVKQFLEQAKDGQIMTVEDVARARVWRESQCPVLTSMQAEIARGEMAIAIGLFTPPNAEKQGIPVDMLRVWLTEERLPDGWRPTHTQGLLETFRTSKEIQSDMNRIKHDGEDVAPHDKA